MGMGEMCPEDEAVLLQMSPKAGITEEVRRLYWGAKVAMDRAGGGRLTPQTLAVITSFGHLLEPASTNGAAPAVQLKEDGQ